MAVKTPGEGLEGGAPQGWGRVQQEEGGTEQEGAGPSRQGAGSSKKGWGPQGGGRGQAGRRMGLEQDQAWAESCLFLQGARYVWNLTGLQQASADASVTHLMGNHPHLPLGT